MLISLINFRLRDPKFLSVLSTGRIIVMLMGKSKTKLKGTMQYIRVSVIKANLG